MNQNRSAALITGAATGIGRAAAVALAGAGFDVVITTGGTGLTPTDRTPEMTRKVIDREVPGIADAIRREGVEAGVPSAVLSRGLAGLAGQTLIINLPGSSGGVRDGTYRFVHRVANRT